VDRFLNLDYKKDGRSFSGLDCYGLVWLYNRIVLRRNLPRFLGKDIYQSSDIEKTVNDNKKLFEEVKDPIEGDLILFSILGFGTHLGVIIKKGKMLHIFNEKSNSCIENYNSVKWRNRILGFYRFTNEVV